MDMTPYTVPKSDQINADDLIAGPRTVTITRVVGTGNSDQPVAVHFASDDGRPYKPCKSMRRVMVHCWGADASQYAGRSMRLIRDPDVMFGGMKVGGVRISHMSHIERDQVMALTATKGKRTGYSVRVLEVAATASAPPRQPMASGPTITDGWPILKPADGSLVTVKPGAWGPAIRKALSMLESPEAVREWRDAMAPHFAVVSGAGGSDDVDAALAAVADRVDALAGVGEAAA